MRTVTVRMGVLSVLGVDELAVVRMAVLEILEVMQRLFTIEQLDVTRLSRSETTNGPAEMNEVRFHWGVHGVHSDLARQTVRLARVARTARRDDVRPVVRPTAG